MRTLLFVLPSVAMAFLSWGVYGPTLHTGQEAMGHSSLRPFLCVGLAYFVVAVLVPLAVLRARGEVGRWTVGGTFWSLAAGAAGAVGALGIILAFRSGGRPVYVMPLVFGCAPVVNTLVTTLMTRSFKQVSPKFLIGVVLVAVGAAGVLYFKSSERELGIIDLKIRELFAVVMSIALVALCWGAYGPVLHKGQMKMEGSRLRPFLCVGLAYFAIAVVVPFAVLGVWVEPGSWTFTGVLWSLGAGALGAIGALGIILAFNFGGKPIYVMPLVFGGAPVVNTFATIAAQGTYKEVPLMFYFSLLLVIVGAVTVLIFAPRPGAKPASKEPAEKEPPPQEPVEKPLPEPAIEQPSPATDPPNGETPNAGDEPKPGEDPPSDDS